MIEIKNIIFTNYKIDFVKCFFCFINHLLPLKLKFKSESFVSLNDNKPQGVITLAKDFKSNTRFKITKLMLEENSYFMAKQLVNYVTSRYRAMGASSFYVVADEKQTDLLNIFKNELNFRMCGFEYLYKINLNNLNYTIPLKKIKKDNIKSVCEFYNENINSFNRFLFARQNYQFKNNILKYIFFDKNEKNILGYFEVISTDNKNFYINFCIDFAYNVYLTDAIKYIYSKLKHKVKDFNLYIKVKDYFMNSKELIAILKENNMEFVSKSQILARDYYKEIRQENIFKNAKIIFNDPTTA